MILRSPKWSDMLKLSAIKNFLHNAPALVAVVMLLMLTWTGTLLHDLAMKAEAHDHTIYQNQSIENSNNPCKQGEHSHFPQATSKANDLGSLSQSVRAALAVVVLLISRLVVELGRLFRNNFKIPDGLSLSPPSAPLYIINRALLI